MNAKKYFSKCSLSKNFDEGIVLKCCLGYFSLTCFDLGFDGSNELVLLKNEVSRKLFWVFDASFEVPMHVFELLNCEGFLLYFGRSGLAHGLRLRLFILTFRYLVLP